MKRMVDPPDGWRYGFPAELKFDETYEELLKRHGYPEDQIEFAIENTRCWREED